MDAVDLFNGFEIGLWSVMALIVLVLGLRESRPSRKRLFFFCAPVLFAFGGSDLVKVYTGAWWRPWWLLCWKGACLLALMVAVFLFVRSR